MKEKIKILVVEDKKENVYLLKVLLESDGYEVVTAENGIEALEKLKENPVDMIISDIMMPEMDGFRLYKKCKSDDKLKGIPFVIYTASYTSEDDKTFALSLGVDRFVVKPIEPKIFLNILKEVFEEHAKKKFVAPKNLVEKEKESKKI